MVVTDYPRTGPIFSGPHEHPYVCETEQSGLGPSADADCSAPTIYRFFYKSTADGQFHAFDPAAAAPADLALTTTSSGRTVPYIVQVEERTINRALPAKAGPTMAIQINDYSDEPADRPHRGNARFSGGPVLELEDVMGGKVRTLASGMSLGTTPMWPRLTPRRVTAPDVTDRAGRADRLIPRGG